MARQSENTALLRAHDYDWLVRRWRKLVRGEGWRMREFARPDGLPVFAIESRREGAPSVYLSAGIHGDEPAAPEALIGWAERRARVLGACDFLIFPCLNPWGLRSNSRLDAKGRDLNRGYRGSAIPLIRAQKKLVGDRTFDAALMMHEDFDAHGIYLYELAGPRPFWGERLLEAGARHLPREPRGRVEGRRCRHGLIRARVKPDSMPEHPEAFYLGFGLTRRSLTFETPSEFSLSARVAAHQAALDELMRLVRGG